MRTAGIATVAGLVFLACQGLVDAGVFPTATFTDTTTSLTANAYNVNVLRELNWGTGTIATTAALGPQHNMSAGNTFGAIDFWEGGQNSLSFNNVTNDPGEWQVGSTAGNPAAVGQLDIDLHKMLTLDVVKVNWRDASQQPVSMKIEGWNGSAWVPLVSTFTADGAAANYTKTFTPTSVSKLRITGTGTRTGQTNMRINEVMAYVADTAASPEPLAGYNLSALAGITETQLSVGQLVGLGGRTFTDQSTLTRLGCVTTMTTPGVFEVDYQAVYPAALMRFDMWGAQVLDGGLKIAISTDHTNWTTVLDNLSTPVAIGTTTLDWHLAPRDLRYIQFTVGISTGGANLTRMADLEIYTPEPASLALLALGGLAALRRRGRRT